MPVENSALENFCKEMDAQVHSNGFLHTILSFQPQPLQEMLETQKKYIAVSYAAQFPRDPGEDPAQWRNRLDAEIEEMAIDAIGPSAYRHNQDYALLRRCSALAYGNSNASYTKGVMQVARQTKYSPDFIHAYICYRQDLLMQDFAREDDDIRQDYYENYHEAFRRTGYAEQVKAAAKQVEARKTQRTEKAQQAAGKQAAAAPKQAEVDADAEAKERENRAAAASMKAELERLQARLAVNGRATPTMTDMRTKLKQSFGTMTSGSSVEDVSRAMQDTLDAGRQYQREKAAQQGSFSSTQLHRLKTINYMLAVDYMGKQDPPLSPGSEKGQKFMLAVKAVMSMAVGKNARLLCNADKLLWDADALSKTPAFSEFIRNSGKSIEELRKTKSLSFARQFTAAMDEAEKKKAVQPVNPAAKNRSAAKKESRNYSL